MKQELLTIETPPELQEVLTKARCLYSKEAIEEAMDRMAGEINTQLDGTNPLVLCVLIGGLLPTASLMQRLSFPMSLDYIHVTRYQGDFEGANLYWKVVPSSSLRDRTVLVVDDILDGGITLAAITEFCQREGASKVYTAVLLDKETRRLPGGLTKPDFSALTVGDDFVFGYGLDYKHFLRNLPGIYTLPAE